MSEDFSDLRDARGETGLCARLFCCCSQKSGKGGNNTKGDESSSFTSLGDPLLAEDARGTAPQSQELEEYWRSPTSSSN